MAMENEMTDLQPRQPGNTPTELRRVECSECKRSFTETWTLQEKQKYRIGRIEREVVLMPECIVRHIYGNGKCRDCFNRDQKRISDENEKTFNAIRLAKIEIGIGGHKPFTEFRFNKYIPKNESQRQALDICSRFNPESENLLLIGATGVGKTHLACATILQFAHTPEQFKRFRVTELFRILRYERKAEEEEMFIKDLIETPLLLIEDLGVQKHTEWNMAVLWEILDRRMEAGRNGLIVTSNHGRGKLSESMGDRVPSRLSAICKIVAIDGDDFRVKKQ